MSAGIGKQELPSEVPTSVQPMEGCVLRCTYYGCKQTFTDVQKLTSHTQSHQIPTESLPGKVFHCSTLGCNGTFPNMQQLMEHMRCHYKPNHYFLCESCRSKLRSYRALFKHLHTCAKVAKSKAAKAEEVSPQPPFLPPDAPESVPELPGAPQGGLEDMQVEPGLPSQPVDSASAAALVAPLLAGVQVPVGDAPQDGPVAPPAAGGVFSLRETQPFTPQPESFPAQTQLQLDGSTRPFSSYLTPMHPSVAPNLGQQQQRPLRPVGPTPPASPALLPPPGSNAVWRKNQGQSFSSRILWEHTRGRYRCLQCGHSTPTRQEMTAHIEGHHKSPGSRLQGDMDFRVVPPFQPRASPDRESSVYTQL